MSTKIKSIYSLGKIAGVSPATISKALNNSAEISAETRRNIQRLAREYNFSPRVLRQHITNIGVLIQHYPNHPLDFNSYLSSVIEGVANYCHDECLVMNIVVGSADEWNRWDMVKELSRRGIDGVVVIRSNRDSNYLNDLAENNFPYFVVNGDAPNAAQSICCDFEKNGEIAGEYLKRLGHNHVGIIVVTSDSVAGQKRMRGFLRIFPNANVILSENFPGKVGFDVGRIGIQCLLEENPAITAVFTTGLEPALSVKQWLLAHDKAIPTDISLLSCDDFPLMAHLTPSLSTVAIAEREIGEFAAHQVHRLIRKINLLEQGKELNLDGKIIERESTACARL